MKTSISYWNANLIVVILLLSIWFLSSDYLDNFQIGGFRLGFWFSQQGSIISFVFIIILYCFLMNKLDKKYDSEGG